MFPTGQQKGKQDEYHHKYSLNQVINITQSHKKAFRQDVANQLADIKTLKIINNLAARN